RRSSCRIRSCGGDHGTAALVESGHVSRGDRCRTERAAALNRPLSIVLLAVVSFSLGAVAQHFYDPRRSAIAVRPTWPPEVDFTREPLWAYGFSAVRKPGETAAPQAPPTRDLRQNEDAGEQTRARTLAGSAAAYSLVDVRDGSNVIDWFPHDHPAPMPEI